MDEVAYCENGDCRVQMFNTRLTDLEKVVIKGEKTQNCPGCGQYGRIKDEGGK